MTPRTAAGRALLADDPSNLYALFGTDWSWSQVILAIEAEAAAQPSGGLREALERLANAADQPLTINSGDDLEWDELREAVEQARAALAAQPSEALTGPGELLTCVVCGDPCRLVHRYPNGVTPPDRTTHSARAVLAAEYARLAKAIGSAYARLSAEQPQVIEGYVNPDGSGKGNWWKG